MTTIPCISSYPAAANLCVDSKWTYTLTPKTDKDGKMTVDWTMSTVKSMEPAKKALWMNAKTAEAFGMMQLASEGGLTAVQRTTRFTGLDKVAKDPTQMKIVETDSKITCKSDITKYDWAATADDKVWKTCAGYKCATNAIKA